MASQIHVTKIRDFGEVPDEGPSSARNSGVWDVEETDVVGQLNNNSSKKRVEILEELILTVKTNGGRLPYSDHESVFRGLGLALSDSNWEIRLKCIVLLQELIPNLKDDLDHCMSLVLSKLISNIGDNKVTLRKAVVSNLHRYMKHTQDMPALLHAIVNTGLENENGKVRREMISALPMLLTKDFQDMNLYGIIQSLAKKLLDTSAENNLKDVSLSTLQSIENLIGEDQFDIYVQRLSPSLQKYYQQLAGKSERRFQNEVQDYSKRKMYAATQHHKDMRESTDKQEMFMDSLEFGCIPTEVVTRINDQRDFKTRVQAVEDLKGVILSLTSDAVRKTLLPHIIPLLNFLSSLLEDSNFKIIIVTLEILHSLVEQIDGNVKNFVKNIMAILTSRMGDNKIVIRQSLLKILIKMMRCSSPQLVISGVFDNLSHRNSRVRQEAINIIIAALLTFPSYEFNLPNVCLVVGPTLMDSKRQVRQAALECFALLAQALGPGHLQPLVQAIDQVEITTPGSEGLMAAVQARLARRQLPRLNGDGLVEYAVSFPSSISQRTAFGSQSADTEWILAARGGSARTARSELMDVESVISSSTRSAPVRTDTQSHTHAAVPRRFMSAGRTRSKLPWEDNPSEGNNAGGDVSGSGFMNRVREETAPSQPHHMWMGDAGNETHNARKALNRRITTSSLNFPRQEATPKDNDNGYTRPEQRTSRTVLDPISDKGRSQGSLHIAGNRGSSTYRGQAKVPAISAPPPPPAAAAAAAVPDDDVDSAYSASTDSIPSRGGLPQHGNQSNARNRAQQPFHHLEGHGDPQTVIDSPQAHRSTAISMGATVTDLSGKNKKTGNTADLRRKPSNQSFSSHNRVGDSLDINENKSTVQSDHDANGRTPFRDTRNPGVHVVVGRGYNKDSFPTTEQLAPDRNSVGKERGEQKRVDLPRSVATSGVAGIGVRGTVGVVSNTEDDSSAAEDDSEEETVGPAKSSSFQRSMAKKQQLKQQQEEEEEVTGQRHDRLQPDRDWQQQKLTKLGSSDTLSEAFSIGGSSSPSPNNVGKTLAPRPTVTPRKTLRTGGETQSSPAMLAAERGPEAGSEEWKPFSDPETALRAAHKKLESDDWEEKMEGLNMIRRIVHFHSQTFSAPPVLHSTILLVVKEVKNLRSQVSRLAIVCLGDMFAGLKKAMDPDVDIVTRQLLGKAGESNNFIRDDVERSLSSMVEGVTPKQALLALIGGGASHKNMAVRRTTAQFLVGLVERMGSGKILSGVKDITDRVLPATAQFVMDGSPETRFYGRKILYLLMSHQDFNRMLTKHLPANTLRNIQDVVDNLKNKGLGEKPNESASARSRRSGQGSRMGSSLRGGSASSSADMNTPPTRRKAMRTDEATMEEVKAMINQLSSSEWRVRYDAVTAFQEMCVERPDTVALHMVKIFDKLLPRLQDANSKVNLHALKVMLEVVPLVKEALQSLISMAVTAIVPNLASKNRQISQTATQILDSYLEHLDHAVLIQPFSNQAQCATGQSKAEMVLKVAYLTDRVYERKSKQIVLHVLPLLWHLLNAGGVGAGGGSASDLRSATTALASTLHSHMGQTLLDRAGSEPSVTARQLNILQEIL